MLFMLFNSTYYKINRLINLILVASCESYVMFNTVLIYLFGEK